MGKKLNSRRGVSILIAMLLFLVASMVSVTIITAALTAAKRVNNDAEQNQVYLTVSSAAKLFAACLEDSRYTVIRTVTNTVENPGEDASSEEVFGEKVEGPLGQVLRSIAKDQRDHPEKDQGSVHTLSLALEDGAPLSRADLSFKWVLAEENIIELRGTITAGSARIRFYAVGEPVQEAEVNRVNPTDDTYPRVTVITYQTVYRWNKVELTTRGG